MRLPKLRKPSLGRVYNIIVFFLGLIALKAFEVLVHDFSEKYDLIIVVSLTAFTVVAGIYYFDSLERRLRESIATMETTVRYVEEIYDPRQATDFTGRVYSELADLVANAKEEILQVGVFHDEVYHTSNHKSRTDYFDALEERVKQAVNKREQFTYLRVHQYPPEKAEVPIRDLLHDKSREHFRKMVDQGSNLMGTRVAVGMWRIERRILMPFRVIDGKTVVLEIDAIAIDGKPYASGIIIIEDRGQGVTGLAKRFQGHFHDLERHAHPIEPRDLE